MEIRINYKEMLYMTNIIQSWYVTMLYKKFVRIQNSINYTRHLDLKLTDK